MRTVNRSAFIVRPKEPYFRWATSIDEDAAYDAEDLQSRVSVYLVREHPTLEEETPPMEDYYDEIFAMELSAWSEDESLWPKSRDLKTFHSWFEVIGQSMVIDLGSNDLQIDEL